MDLTDTQLVRIAQEFCAELARASGGKKTDLSYIRHTKASLGAQQITFPFQVIVMGGTQYAHALVTQDDTGYTLTEKHEGDSPVLPTKESLSSFISTLLNKKVKTVGFNFAYAMKPTVRNGLLDGILLTTSKEHAMQGLVGKAVGKEIEEFLGTSAGRTVRVAVANDTICLLLSGLSRFTQDTLVGGVVGSGVNFAFFCDQDTMVNLESAHFKKFPRSQEGIATDRQSLDVGQAQFEKEVSGRYLYQHFNYMMKKMGTQVVPLTSTRQLDDLARHGSQKERSMAQKLMEYSAKLVACQVAGIALWKKNNLKVCMEGSLFWYGHRYADTVSMYVRKLVPAYKVEFVKIVDSGLLGAAYLVGA